METAGNTVSAIDPSASVAAVVLITVESQDFADGLMSRDIADT